MLKASEVAPILGISPRAVYDIPDDQQRTRMPQIYHPDKLQPNDKTARAISRAELWAAGKLIGGDAHEVSATLLKEVRRLQALLAGQTEALQPRDALKR